MAYIISKTALMTVSEYNEKITPTIKEFNKFIRKNGKFLKKADFYGVVYLTYTEYFNREMESLLKRDHKSLANKEYIDNSWLSNSDRVITEIPKDVHEKYLEYLAFFTDNFGENTITRIESDELKSNKRSVRRAIDSDMYVEVLKDQLLSTTRLIEIFDSVGLKVPKHILQLKHKIETEGYNRTAENKFLKQTKEFEDILRVAIAPHYEKLKDIKKKEIMFIIEKFEKDYGSKELYKFVQSFHNRTFQEEVKSRINTFFKGMYDGLTIDREYIYKRVENFDTILDKKAIDFAEQFVTTFIYRLNDKLKVVTDKFGSPTIEVSDVNFTTEFNGLVKVTYSNGVQLNIEAEVIIAGGYIQVEHYRYLLKPFYKGKFIDLENIDNLNFN